MTSIATSLIADVKGIRTRLFLAVLTQRVFRWLFVAAIILCLAAITSKLLSIVLPWTAVTAVATAALAVAVILSVVHGLSVPRCALLLDRSLHLHERVSTAVEAIQGRDSDSPVVRALIDDAHHCLRAAPVGTFLAHHWNIVLKQMGWVIPALALAGLLWAAPDLRRWQSFPDRSGQEVARQEADKLKLLAAQMAGGDARSLQSPSLPPELLAEVRQAIQKLLQDNLDLREKFLAMARLQDKVVKDLSGLDPKSSEYASWLELLEQIREAEAALGNQLKKAGYPVGTMHPPSERGPESSGGSPHAAQKGVSDIFKASADEKDPTAFRIPEGALREMLQQRPWPSQYDALIQKYFTE